MPADLRYHIQVAPITGALEGDERMNLTTIVSKNARGTYDIYINGVLVEGGFFDRAVAVEAAAHAADFFANVKVVA